MIDNTYLLHQYYFIGSKLRSNMTSIIICDDDKLFVSKLKSAVEVSMKNNRVYAKINTFCSAEEIGSEVLSACDIAFLDIDFAGKEYNGMDIARKIRSLRSDAVIVFVTNYLEYAPEGYEVQAFRYLLKNEIPQKLEVSISQMLTHIRTVKSNIKIQVDGELIDLRVQDILYIESMGHTLIFHVVSKECGVEKEYSCYSTLAQMEVDLAKRGFLRVHKSYLVNMAHIKKMNCTGVFLDNGSDLRVSSKTYSECKKKYMIWKGQH